MTNEESRPALFLNPHVRQRMAQRGITEAAINWVLGHYHTRFPAAPQQGVRPAVILQGTFEGRELRVYVQRGTDPPYVKTVAWKDE